MELVTRFLRYVGFDTQSDEEGKGCPSTERQMAFARYLADELKEAGLEEVELDGHGYLYATLPANTEEDVPTVGFIAHIDTSPDCSGKDVKPRIVEHYDGGDIVLSAEDGIVTSPTHFPELLDHVGEDLIVTDGHTLLGADDKAGIAEIVQAMVYLREHPEIRHGKIRVGFNPDEENAMRVAADFIGRMPAGETPETTEGYEGFYHLTGMKGSVEEAVLSYIIRDHDRRKFEERKAFMQQLAGMLNAEYGAGTVVVETKDQYYNMREKVEPMMHIIDIARQAIEEAGAKCRVKAIRGGTDGAQLSFKGLPCPNIFAGGLNFHGRNEFVPVQSMEKAMMTVVKIAELTAAR